MSLHPSLRGTAKNKQQRSILKRIERVKKLIDEEDWQEDKVFRLPKIKTIKLKIKKEKPKEETVAKGVVTEGETGTETTEAREGIKESTKGKPEAKAKPETKGSKEKK